MKTIKEVCFNHRNTLEFPSYLEFQFQRLQPIIKTILYFGFIYIIVISMIDINKSPDLKSPIIILYCIPLLTIISINYSLKIKTKQYIPKIILLMGLFSFIAFCILHTMIKEKNLSIPILVIYYLICIIVLSPLFSKKSLGFILLLAILILSFIMKTWEFDTQLQKQFSFYLFAITVFSYFVAIKSYSSSQENYTIIKHTHQMNMLDTMTNLYNRRAINLWAKENIPKGKSVDSNISLIMIDLDDFKNINDNYGHRTGDIVIITVAKMIKEYTNDNIKAVRIGGDEYILLVKDNVKVAKNIVEELLSKIHQYTFESINGETFNITASAGISKIDRNTKSLLDLYKLADSQLYKAKSQGKNTWV